MIIAAVVIALVFSVLGLVASLVTATIVIGWRNSTHKIEYRKPEETVFEIDAPKHIVDQLPSSPEPQTLEQWVRQQQNGSLDNLYEQDVG